VSALTLEFERTQEKLDRRPIPGETPYERMMYVLSRVTRTMQREPMLTEAMTGRSCSPTRARRLK
jgi:hypothetical protein